MDSKELLKWLSYPIDSKNILRKRKTIKKNLLSRNFSYKVKIAILGGSTTSEIKNILELFLLKNDIKPYFYESKYGQYYEEALFENKNLDEFKPDIIYIHSTHLNISNHVEINCTASEVDCAIEREVDKYSSIWRALDRFNCNIIQNNFDYPVDRNLGNLDGYDIHGKVHFINRLNLELSDCARKNNNIFIHDINYLASQIGLTNWFDRSLWYQAKYAVSMDSIPKLAFNLSKLINAIIGNSKKCLVLDLDNTCWGGVIGDDGICGIDIGVDTTTANVYTDFQKYAKNLKDRGIILCVCSKNDLKNAKEGFEHPDSVLTLSDFSSFKANWRPKYENILSIANEVNIGIDSMVFVDDNPVEREIVMDKVPSISVPNVGSDVINFIDHIDKGGYFELPNLSSDDIDRSVYYQDNKQRLEQQAVFKSYDNFLLSLDMESEIKTFSNLYIDRITQLTNKTNQFNLTTKRYNASEMDSVYHSDTHIKIYGRLKDKFGDNGLVSVIIGNIVDSACHVDVWLMSCRVLQRKMELAMLDELINHCKKRKVLELFGYYYKSSKNEMVSSMYMGFGFELVKRDGLDTVWRLNISSYEKKNKLIEVLNG
jgi:FkbH-like protein